VHELGMCTSIVEAVEKRAGERQVAKVRARVGRLHRADRDALLMAFEVAAAGTVVEGAEADLVFDPAHLRCSACSAEAEVEDLVAICPVCGSGDVLVSGGDALVLESIEYKA
jgi:hydrogenase nickel incorporation protein HypA/HybF